MTRMKNTRINLLLLLIFLAWQVEAQDTLRAGFEVITDISDAHSLAVDPEELIYVVTASELIQLDVQGTIRARLDGTSTGAFGELSDIDPGNGLIWVIADEEKGSLFRFSKELLHLETIRVPRGIHVELERSPRLDSQDGFSVALGQPIAVSTGASGDLFAIEASSQSVLKWDASRRLERVIGDFGTGAGQLIEPVSIATDATSLYVADRALGAIKIYDYFGGYKRDIKTGQDLNNIAVVGEELWVIFPESIRIYSTRGSLSSQIMIKLDAPLIAAVAVSDHMILLTSEQLLRISTQDTFVNLNDSKE